MWKYIDFQAFVFSDEETDRKSNDLVNETSADFTVTSSVTVKVQQFF